MYRYLLFMIGLMPLITLAQQKTKPTLKPVVSKPIIPADTIYFDQDWARTDVPEDRKYARLIRHDADGQPTGTVRDFYYPSWKKQWEGKLLSEDPEQANGLCTFWYETGKMKARGTYARGQALSDYQEWRPDGTPIKCKSQLVEALPSEQSQIHSSSHGREMQHVFQAVLPPGTTSLLYRFDIRDEGQPPITWRSAASLAMGSAFSGLSLMEMGLQAMRTDARSQQVPTISTQCHYFITTSEEAANNFQQSEGQIFNAANCLYQTSSTQHDIRPLTVPPGTRRIFFCVKNDNSFTAALATLSVTAVVQECK